METKELNSIGEQLTSSTQTPSRYQALLFQTKERELLHGHDLDSLLPILQQASENIRATLDATLVCVINWFQDSNSRRLTGLFKRKDVVQIQERQQMLAKQLKELEAALSEFRLVERKKLIKPYEKFFDPDTKLLVKRADMFASRYIFNIVLVTILTQLQGRCMFASYLSIPSMLSQNAWLICSRSSLISIPRDQQSKIWFPGRISSLKDSITGDDFESSESPFSMGSSQDPASFDTGSRSATDSEASSISDGQANDTDKTTHTEQEDIEKGRLADAPSTQSLFGLPYIQ